MRTSLSFCQEAAEKSSSEGLRMFQTLSKTLFNSPTAFSHFSSFNDSQQPGDGNLHFNCSRKLSDTTAQYHLPSFLWIKVKLQQCSDVGTKKSIINQHLAIKCRSNSTTGIRIYALILTLQDLFMHTKPL